MHGARSTLLAVLGRELGALLGTTVSKSEGGKRETQRKMNGALDIGGTERNLEFCQQGEGDAPVKKTLVCKKTDIERQSNYWEGGDKRAQWPRGRR